MDTIRTNLKNNASTQYTNFNFNSMCMFNGVPLGAGDSGFFKLNSGNTDNSTSIAWFFVMPKSEYDTLNKKRMRYLYMGYYCDGDITVELTGDDKTTIGPYTMSAVTSEGQQRRRVTIGHGLDFGYGQLKISGAAGCDFSADLIQVHVDIKKYGGR